uniref:Transcriptional regulator, IclR family n=1 Tax=uncultured Thiotrichaceae bacterium TaxID=298394 RepID=A0A6S6U707_9GAMM|nr:MAG: Transcriptional regulator, IclR family [uncultured Thiotrichaceae bacterium]
MDSPTDKAVKTGTLGKIMDVLDAIAGTPGIRFTDVLEEVGQPRGTIHRHLSHLLEEGLVILNQDGGYELGTRFLKLASKSWQQNSLRNIAGPLLTELQQQTGETVHLAMLQGPQVVYLDKVESNQSVRMHSQIGNASPIYCTGVGKAMLSALPDEKIEGLIAQFDFHQYTEHTLKDSTAMWEEIKQIRACGYAEDREEHEMGIRCVAAPLVCKEGRLLGGISTTAPVYRIKPETLQQWRGVVTEAARSIGEACRYQLAPGHNT